MILLFAASSYAATLVVSSGGPYTAIQDAIDAAADGDTITVAAGTWSECLDLTGKDLTIRGVSSGSTTIDGAGLCDNAIVADSSEALTLEGVTIENGAERGIYLKGGSLEAEDVTFLDLGVDGSTAFSGGGIYADNAQVTLTDSLFDGNLGYKGGAIYLTGADLQADNVEFTENEGQLGGAIGADTSATVSLLECTFEGNIASYSGYGKGGAIYAYESVLSDDGSTFADNLSAFMGGAISAESNSELALSNSTFDGNAIDLSSISSSSGGAIYAADLEECTIENSDFNDNVAYFYGGAIFLDTIDDTCSISDSRFEGNSVSSSRGGAVGANNGAAISIIGCTFEGNTAAEAGGAVSFYENDGFVTDSVFTENTTTSSRDAFGGAIFAFSSGSGESLEVQGSTFSGNVAALSGGGILAQGLDEVLIENSDFTANIASDISNTDVYYGGGLMAYEVDDLEVSNSSFCTNTADLGGGVYLELVGAASFVNVLVQENTAAEEGGGLYTLDSDLDLENSALLGNATGTYGGGGYFATSDIDAVNTIFAWSTGEGVYAADSSTASASSFTYSSWYDNSAGDRGGSYSFSTSTGGNITSDPLLASYTVDGDCSDDYAPATGSPLIDAGDPTIKDVDGSRSDIGLYGGPDSGVVDDDDDGYYSATDCDDSDPDIYPGATEVCDYVDNDCDGTVDEGLGGTYYPDDDGDSYGDPSGEHLCSLEPGYVTNDDDCDDSEAGVYPGATEICDGLDNDCDGATDDGASGKLTWYGDNDDDGHGGSTFTMEACFQPDGYAASDDDCDDNDETVYPGAPEACDEQDNDCDGDTDEDVTSGPTWYGDSDGDGYGGDSFSTVACDQPDNYVDNDDDCDDTDAEINPDAAEIVGDGTDQNCDGSDEKNPDDTGDTGDSGGPDDTGDTDDSGDTSGGDDTGLAGDTGDSDKDDCAGCSTAERSPAAAGLWLLALAGLAWRRRAK